VYNVQLYITDAWWSGYNGSTLVLCAECYWYMQQNLV